MPNPGVSGTYRYNDLPVATGHLHPPGRSDNLIFISLVITVKLTHSTHDIHFLSLERELVTFSYHVSLFASENRFSEATNKLKAPVWDKLLRNRDLISSQAVESVLP